MLVGYFTERPYQDPDASWWGTTGRRLVDLDSTNGDYDPKLGAELYNRYLDEKIYAEEMGFDALALNEHHSTPFCMGQVTNVEAAILARVTKKAKIVLIGNILPIWDDPLWLAEQLAIIDMISHGRLIAGWVRGTGRESVAHDANSTYNWERFQEAHEFIVKAWTQPGPFRFEGEHYNYRYVNPWARPYKQPHPLIMIPGAVSKRTVEWAAARRYPYVMLATRLEPTKQSFDYYDECARAAGYEAGPQHRGYLFKVHVDETEELAHEVGRKFLTGPGNIFLEGSRGDTRSHLQDLPGLTDRRNLLPTGGVRHVAAARGQAEEVARPLQLDSAERHKDVDENYADLLEAQAIITGTPKTVIPKIRKVLEYIRPGSIFMWDGDGAMTHEDSMRSLRLMGEEVLPAIREISKELGLVGPTEVDPMTNLPVAPA
ncbi:MAG: LLM class flavin-dependent oxidoreductase [Dehalococcoidia bacterium]|nr:LLM class flavin-dependent oxidoreductase [Dehalococcoidia bacterium]MCB9485108.1 LLM class flavin-dependent oxidoreductase [Thermoflexaceae bacterium]